jgi:ribosome-associated toxin RatA of RatAB toxin-antitoxin module
MFYINIYASTKVFTDIFTPWYSWNTAKVEVKLQSINQSINTNIFLSQTTKDQMHSIGGIFMLLIITWNDKSVAYTKYG